MIRERWRRHLRQDSAIAHPEFASPLRHHRERETRVVHAEGQAQNRSWQRDGNARGVRPDNESERMVVARKGVENLTPGSERRRHRRGIAWTHGPKVEPIRVERKDAPPATNFFGGHHVTGESPPPPCQGAEQLIDEAAGVGAYPDL